MTDAQPRPSDAPPASRAQSRADRLLQHCVYMIATGKWRPGQRLPSVREMRRDWGVNQLTVQSAYGRLAAMGLAELRPRSGCYVSSGGTLERLSAHRYELENLLRTVSGAIRRRTSLSTLGVLRYLAELEEIRCAESPEIAFVECTHAQASGHAEEIAARLRVPVMPLTTGQLAGGRRRVPSHLRLLLTSSFHLEEVRGLARPPALTVRAVPIEVSPELTAALPAGARSFVLLEHEETMASHIGQDVRRLLGDVDLEVALVDDPARALARLLKRPSRRPGPVVLLSPRLWGELDPAWRTDARTRQVRFRICESAWPRIAEALGLPLRV